MRGRPLHLRRRTAIELVSTFGLNELRRVSLGGGPVGEACGIAAEVATNIYEMVFDELDAPVERVSGADVPLPYAKELEQACIPHAADVVRAVRKVLNR